MSLPFSETYLGKIRKKVGSRLLQVPSFRVVLENDDGKVLLQKRADFGVWGLPGGHPEERESIQAAIIREIFEETGLTITQVEAYGFTSAPGVEIIRYPNGDVIHSYNLGVFTKKWTGKLIESNEETLELKFFDPKGSLPEMLGCEKASLLKYIRFRETGSFQLD